MERYEVTIENTFRVQIIELLQYLIRVILILERSRDRVLITTTMEMFIQDNGKITSEMVLALSTLIPQVKHLYGYF